MNANDHYERLYGDLGLNPQSFMVYVGQMMHINPDEIREKMQ